MGGRRVAAVWAVVVALSGVAACGDSGDGGAGGSNKSAAKATSTTVAVRVETSVDVPTPPPGAIAVMLARLEFSPAQLSAPAGRVVLHLTNGESTDVISAQGETKAHRVHDLVISGPTGLPLARSARLEIGQTGTLTVEGLKPGSYPFYCSTSGHSLGGMKGALTIT